MHNWDPLQYLSFENERLRPALDLLTHLPIENPKIIYDLGCGPGNITKILKIKWPLAKVIGIDSSVEMLNKAKNLSKKISWILEDLRRWIPLEKIDLIFSNATLHWLDNHETLFPKLMSYLNPNGVLAIQMPDNFTAPTYRCIYETVNSGPWKESLISLIREKPVLTTSEYYRILSPISNEMYLWQTIYNHFLEGENPVVEWTKGSALRPFLEKLDEKMKPLFLKQYIKRIQQNYKKEYNGKTILPFKRIFLIAKN